MPPRAQLASPQRRRGPHRGGGDAKGLHPSADGERPISDEHARFLQQKADRPTSVKVEREVGPRRF